MKNLIALVLIIIYYESSIRLGLYDTEKVVIETRIVEHLVYPDDGGLSPRIEITNDGGHESFKLDGELYTKKRKYLFPKPERN